MYSRLLLPDLKLMIVENDTRGLAEFCSVLHPVAVAEVLEDLDPPDVWRVLSNSPLARRVEIFEFISLSRQVELVQSLERKALSQLLEEMSSDDRADLISRMEPERVEDLLPLIAQAERSDIRKLLSYPENSAGALMTTEYASLPEEITVREALDQLRKQAPDRETIYYIYILDEGRRLDGFISLRDLILAKPNAKLADIMQRDVVSVRVGDDQEQVAQAMARYDFIAIPVVDEQNRLVGIITHDDVLDVLQEEADEDAYRLAAVEPLEDSYLDTPLKTLAWKRGVWLLFLSVVALVNAQVLQSYQQTSAEYVWMLSFLPLVLASGGNAGSQSATLIIRTIAAGEFNKRDNLRMARREVALGLALGCALAALDFLVCVTWFGRDAGQAAVVAQTVVLVVVMGTVTGAAFPIIFRHLGMDPALMSNPLISALVDIMGVFIYYTVAIVLLEHMLSR